MKLIGNTALQLSVPDTTASEILKNVAKSQLISHGPLSEVLVYWGYQECEYLAYLFDQDQPCSLIPSVPSPMLRDYTWPGIYPPFEHQRTTASYLSLRRRAFCFNEAGTGKTAAAVWAADYLMNMGLVKRVLIVCPVSIMISAWQGDIFKTAMHRSAGVAHGERDKRKKIIGGDYDFVIINYDGVTSVAETIKEADFDLIIVDEANAYKNTSTKRWKVMSKILQPHTRLWMMTGTPASQSPEDAYGLGKLVSPYRVPKFKTEWRDLVMYKVGKFKMVPKLTSTDTVFKALQPAIRFTKKECLDLPEVVYETRDVAMTVQVHHYYAKLKKQLLIEAAGEEISAVNAAAAMSKLLQISGGAVYSDDGNIVEFDISPRLNVLSEVLDETSNKVLVFVPHLHTIDVIKRYLDKGGVTSEIINGSVTPVERAKIFNRFQTQPDPKVLLIQPQSASHGVTLTAADTIVFWGPVTSVETFIQCVGRIDRVGQVNSMTVVMLQGSDMERKVYTMLRGKMSQHFSLVELYKQSIEEAINE